MLNHCFSNTPRRVDILYLRGVRTFPLEWHKAKFPVTTWSSDQTERACALLIYPSSLWGAAALRSFTCTPSLGETETRKYDHHWCGRKINRVVQTADEVGVQNQRNMAKRCSLHDWDEKRLSEHLNSVLMQVHTVDKKKHAVGHFFLLQVSHLKTLIVLLIKHESYQRPQIDKIHTVRVVSTTNAEFNS